MDLGVRHIRTAGKGSGSIELTLPTGLRDLVGLPCRITLRDGSRPDIVLQPDLQPAHAAFAGMWDAMAALLLSEHGHAPFPLGGFGFGLQPRAPGERPYLCWRDGLALAAAAAPEAAAVSRTLAALGHAMAEELGIAATLAAGFGAACGTLAAGPPPWADGQEAADLAAAALRGRARPGDALAAARGSPTGDAAGPFWFAASPFWRAAGPVLTAVTDLFLGWTADPSGHALLRAAWRRGRSVEMSGG